MKKIFLCLVIIIFCVYFLTHKNNENKETVSFSSWGSQSEVKILNKLLSDFEEETNIKVKFIHIPQNYFQKLHLLFASDLAPDVVFINNHYLKMYTDANLLEVLTPFFEDKDKYHKPAIDCLTDKGEIYAIPRDISSLVLYVNKDILKKENIQIKNKINTISELESYLKKLTKKEHFAINNEEDTIYWLYFLAANGGGALDDSAKQIIINSKKSIEALNKYAQYSNKYHYAPTKAEIGSMTTAQMFINGKLAMYLGGRWMLPKFNETINFDFDIIEFPSSAENKVYIDASGWAINKKSKNKENAVKLIKYLSSEESSKYFQTTGLITPARKLEEEEKTHIFIEMIKNSKPTPTNKYYNRINDILKEKAQNVLYGEKTAEEAFDEKTIKELEKLL